MRWQLTPSAHGYAEEDTAEQRVAFTSSAAKYRSQSTHTSAFLRSYLVSVVRVVPVSGVRAFLPGLRTPFHVQQGNNQHAINADLVQHSIGEAPNNASPSSFREEWPCFRKSRNPIRRALYFLR
jgi:hypothetical protein